MATSATRWVAVGRVMGVFGVRGELRVEAFTELPERIIDFPGWWIGRADNQTREYTPKEGRRHGKGVVVKVQGVDTPEAGKLLYGQTIFVPRHFLPVSNGDEYYWADLIGCDVVDQTGERIGKVVAMMETGANDVMVLSGPAGEVLIPYISDVVRQVDVVRGRIEVNALPGLLTEDE